MALVAAGAASWATYAITHPGGIESSPLSWDSSPRSSAKRLVLPLPFAPISPTLSPGCTVSDASSSSSFTPRASERFEMRSMIDEAEPRSVSAQVVVVIDDQRCVIGESPVGIDRRGPRSCRDARRRDLVIDPPTHVLRPGLTAVRPPGVLIGLLVDAAEHVDKAKLVEYACE